jgi:hypothetical protein
LAARVEATGSPRFLPVAPTRAADVHSALTAPHAAPRPTSPPPAPSSPHGPQLDTGAFSGPGAGLILLLLLALAAVAPTVDRRRPGSRLTLPAARRHPSPLTLVLQRPG